MEIRLLGPVELVGARGDVIPLAGNKVRGLLAVLALEARHTVTPQRLIDILWDDQAVNGLNVVQVLVSKLRRSLAEAGEANVVKTQTGGYELDVAAESIDLARFETFVEQARTTHAEQAAGLLQQALSLWRGTALSGVPDTERMTAMRARLEEQRLTAVDDLNDAGLQLGRHHDLVAHLEALVVDQPLRERRWGQLIKAMYSSGRQADAMRAFQRARDVLIEQIGAEPGPELRRLEAAVLAQDDTVLVATPPATSRPVGDGFRRRGNLRHPINTCLGRESVLAELTRLVEQHRLITLVGPGGVGKTRLAQEFGVACATHLADGVWWIDLAAARSGPDVATALQHALGMEGGPATDVATAIDAVIAVLSERHALLIFDNCEQLVDDVRLVVGDLLGRCSRLRIVATSREGLDLVAERLFEVNPLAADAAVALFEARVAAGIVTGDSEDTIREICERLDRLPLALELAAARTRYLRLDEIKIRLSNRFELLGDASRDADAHQRNLRAVAEWSYELLDAPERLVFERLSVFADGAPVAGARAVCAGDGVDSDDVEHLLHRLVDKSLVVVDRSGAATRFRMLQTLADYAAERLDVHAGADQMTHRAHAEWVRDLASTVAFGEPTEGATIAAVQEEDAAVRDAVGWALENDPPLALEISMSLSAFWFGTMRVSSGWELLSASLGAASPNDEPLYAAAQAWAALFAAMLQDPDSAQRHADSALETERRLADPLRLARVTLLIALAASYRNDPDWERWIDESRAHFAHAALRAGSGPGYARFAAGAVELLEGDLVSASGELRAAIAEFRQHRDHLGLILAVSRLGELAYRSGDIELYAEMHEELFELGLASRSSGVTTGALARLGHARLMQGDVADAERLAREALAGSGASFMPVVNGYVFKTSGLVNLALGHLDDGRRQLSDSIEAFSQGTGRLGIGQAALCWIDLSGSYAAAGALAEALATAERAVEAAEDSGEPWVLAQADAHRQVLRQGLQTVQTA